MHTRWNVGILTFKQKVFTINQVLEAAVVCAVISWIFREVGHSLTLHVRNIRGHWFKIIY